MESEDQSAPAELPIPLQACSRGLPLVRFSPRQSIAVFIAPNPDGSEDGAGSSEYDDEERTEEDVVTVQWSSVYWNRCVRQLVDQSHALFTQVQEAEPSPDGVLPYSKLYRAALHECILGLNTVLDDGAMEEEQEQVSDQSNLYSLLEVVWHLCEILFIEVLPAGCLIQQLLEWVRWHSTHTDGMIQEVLSSPRPSSSEHYWPAVYSTVLQGRPRECVELLSHHDYCRYHPQAHTSISELLRRMPMVASVAGRSRAELRTSWAEWRSECVRRRQRGDYTGCPQLHTISGLLCGEENCFKEQDVVDSCDQWYELLVGRLLYCSPLVVGTDYELHYIAQECMSLYHHDGGQWGVFDQLLMTALQNNMIDTLRLSSSKLSDWWFVAHLSNILHRCGALVVSQYEYGGKLTEFVLAEYANSLMANPSLWHIAMDYFSYCPEHGRGYMMACIERVPLSTEYKALKVLKACTRYQLKEQGHSVCKVMAVRGYRSGRLGVALTWCIRSNDSAFAAFIAEKYFDNYHNLGQFRDLDLLDHLQSAMLLSPRLAFLGKYRQFHIQYSNGEFTAAAQLLVAILSSGIVPQQYWSTILIDALPLLELKNQLLFSTDQTTSFMHYLAADHDDQDQLDDSHKQPLLLLALSRNIQHNGLHCN